MFYVYLTPPKASVKYIIRNAAANTAWNVDSLTPKSFTYSGWECPPTHPSIVGRRPIAVVNSYQQLVDLYPELFV